MEKNHTELADSYISEIENLLNRFRNASALDKEYDEIYEAIIEFPLEILVRPDWHHIGGTSNFYEYKIILCTVGPACRIIGKFDSRGPITAEIQYADWVTPWASIAISMKKEGILLEFASFFLGDAM